MSWIYLTCVMDISNEHLSISHLYIITYVSNLHLCSIYLTCVIDISNEHLSISHLLLCRAALIDFSSLISWCLLTSHSSTLSSAVVSSPVTSCSTWRTDMCDGTWRLRLTQHHEGRVLILCGYPTPRWKNFDAMALNKLGAQFSKILRLS